MFCELAGWYMDSVLLAEANGESKSLQDVENLSMMNCMSSCVCAASVQYQRRGALSTVPQTPWTCTWLIEYSKVLHTVTIAVVCRQFNCLSIFYFHGHTSTYSLSTIRFVSTHPPTPRVCPGGSWGGGGWYLFFSSQGHLMWAGLVFSSFLRFLILFFLPPFGLFICIFLFKTLHNKGWAGS